MNLLRDSPHQVIVIGLLCTVLSVLAGVAIVELTRSDVMGVVTECDQDAYGNVYAFIRGYANAPGIIVARHTTPLGNFPNGEYGRTEPEAEMETDTAVDTKRPTMPVLTTGDRAPSSVYKVLGMKNFTGMTVYVNTLGRSSGPYKYAFDTSFFIYTGYTGIYTCAMTLVHIAVFCSIALTVWAVFVAVSPSDLNSGDGIDSGAGRCNAAVSDYSDYPNYSPPVVYNLVTAADQMHKEVDVLTRNMQVLERELQQLRSRMEVSPTYKTATRQDFIRYRGPHAGGDESISVDTSSESSAV